MKKYQELEKQASEMLAKVEEIQKEIGRLKEEEKATKLPNYFSRVTAMRFLEKPIWETLGAAFAWISTPQGYNYWNGVSKNLYRGEEVPDEAIIQIQKWVIQSYKEQYGS